jgi:hypothetical protein
MPTANIYAGPGKLFFQGVALWPEQVNGLMTYRITQQKLDFAQAMHGRVGSQLGDTVGKLTITPFDNWSAIPHLFPAYIGASYAGGAAQLFAGQRPHNPFPFGGGAAGADIPGTIWNPQGLTIVINRLAVTRHPDLHLGVGKALFGAAEFTSLQSSTAGTSPVPIGNLDAFFSINESGQPDPGGQFGLADFVRESWTGAWGTVAGFGGDGGASLPVQAEDEWIISCNATYNEIKVQQQTLAMELASVEFMARCRPYGPSWTQIKTAAMTGRLLGSRWGSPGSLGAIQNLVLTSASSAHTITLANVDLHEAGFEFGGTRLTTGEVGFVTQVQFVAGVAQPQILFSAA